MGGQVSYDEGVFVGYRYFQQNVQTPLFPFGYGLSYTSFRYDRLRVTNLDGGGDAAAVEVRVRNVGPRTGSAVVQVYVGRLPTTIPTPPRQLAGFARVTLKPGQDAPVTVRIPKRVLSYWEQQTQSWVTPAGTTALYVGSSSADNQLTGHLSLGHARR